MANFANSWAKNELINIIGSCCGTRPEHTKALKVALKDMKPRKIRDSRESFRLSGLNPFNLS